MDLKPSVFALNQPANSSIRFSNDFGGETNLYQGFDVNLESRFRNGAFLKAGIGATARTFDQLQPARRRLRRRQHAPAASWAPRRIPTAARACHREYPYRPDVKMSGSYTLPWDIQLAGTFQHSRGIQTGGAGPSQLANWTLTSAAAAPMIGRNWTGVASRIVGLMWEGQDYGKHNLNQLDIKLAKRFTVDRVKLRVDFDLYNLFNSSWPYTLSNTYANTATSNWLRPTNVLQHRFFKFGGHIILVS